MTERLSQKQYKFLRVLYKERYAPHLEEKFQQFVATDLSKQGASELIEQFLNSPKKSESQEYKDEVAKKVEQAKEQEKQRAELAEQRKQAEIDNCDLCKIGHPVPHFNCSFVGRVGHGRHCSADLCL